LWTSIAHAGTPKKGGTYRIGLAGASTAESLDPATYGTGVINHFMVGAIGNCLTEIDHNGEVIPELAESWEPNSGADVWTFRLRRDVTFHNGKFLSTLAVGPIGLLAPFVHLGAHKKHPCDIQGIGQLGLNIPAEE
jgi:ABC-type transport system substrate-binding protein